MRFGVFALSAMLLSGCLGTPQLPLLSDVELAKDAPESGLVAADVEAPDTVLQELQSVGNVPDVPPEDAVPEKPRRGLAALFGRLKNRTKETAPAVAVDAADVDADVADVDEADADAAPTPAPDSSTEEEVAIAMVAPAEATSPRRERKGLFGPRRAKASEFAQMDPGVVLPFGQIGLACRIRGGALGKEVDRFPERGKGYRLFDTNPSMTGPRTHYITGFKDGCPRQFTASLALLESPVLHEQLLSVKSSQGQHSTDADTAFQKIRAQVCQIGRCKACPEKRIAKMEKSMAFVTTYERFGGNARWTEILLHNGKVVANSSHVQ